jgi:hypothetical protein
LHRRAFAPGVPTASLAIAEIPDARSLQVVREYNKGASISLALDGQGQSAALVRELQQDLIAWRWDDTRGADVPVGRYVICQAQDTLSEQAYTLTLTGHDYLAMLERRLLTARVVYTQREQDLLAADLIARAKTVSESGGQSFGAAAYLPLNARNVDPSGAYRSTPSGQPRDRTYEAQQKLDEALFNLAACENGFDYDVVPTGGDDNVRIFFPYQGVLRTDLVLEYGLSVRALSRTTNSADYANAWRVVGASSNPNDSTAPPLYGERHNSDALDATRGVGLWHSGDNASDVTVQATLNEKAGADLAMSGVLLPSYSLELRSGWYGWGNPNIGDVVTLRIRAGRLNGDTEVRVLAITHDVNDDTGDDDIKLTVGRPDVNFADLFTRADRDINALARR